jgi:hypothetical protein
MAKRSDAELIAILNSPEGDYQPSAVEAAKRIFEGRNLSVSQVETAKMQIAMAREKDEAKANKPLAIGPKILAFIFPGLYLLAVSGLYNAEGYDRKARELRRWTLYGFCFYGAVIALIILSEVLTISSARS